jgi:hypothetical protein
VIDRDLDRLLNEASRSAFKLWQNTLFGGHKYWDALSKEPSASNLNSSIPLIL